MQRTVIAAVGSYLFSILGVIISISPSYGRIPEFLRDVAPILDKGGCSVAACHGKFGGRGGFQLSLLTLSPEDDYEPIVKGDKGRRVDLAHPEKSLFLLKPSGGVSHGGGERFPANSASYRTILSWLKAGAPFSDKDPRLTKLQVLPAKAELKGVGIPLQLKVVATYTDGSKRDVTGQAVYMSSNPGAIVVSDTGVVKGLHWGGGSVMARYLGVIAPGFITLAQAGKNTWPTIVNNNLIDRYIFNNLKSLNVLPSALSSDTEFLRRVTLDTLGRLPTSEEITAFIADHSPNKRTQKIDALLNDPGFADYRAMRLADLLRVNPRKIGYNSLSDRSAYLFYEWIWKSVTINQPWDRFTRDILTARGSIYQNGPAAFYRIERAPNDRMETIGQAFLGVRMACARCHKHPFDRWTTDNYWNFAAFCDKVAERPGRLQDEAVIVYAQEQKLINQSVNGKNKGKPAPPTYLGEKEPAPESKDMISDMADWIISHKNPFFARATINRLWSWYFGEGIINPVDDMRSTYPESVPGLLDALAGELINRKYDVKQIIRLILTSRTWQLSSLPNSSNLLDDRYFSRSYPRPMPAQVFLDMVNQATGAKETFSSYAERASAVQAAAPISNYFLDSFGQSHREYLADLNPKLEPNIVQTLHMINSSYIDNKIRGGGTMGESLKANPKEAGLIKALYLKTLSRPPTPAEIARETAIMGKAKDRNSAAQDLLWALVSSREFYFNH